MSYWWVTKSSIWLSNYVTLPTHSCYMKVKNFKDVWLHDICWLIWKRLAFRISSVIHLVLPDGKLMQTCWCHSVTTQVCTAVERNCVICGYASSSGEFTLCQKSSLIWDASTFIWRHCNEIDILLLSHTMAYASVTSNHGPRTILSPVRFLARKAEWSARRNFTSVLFSWSHQATGPVRLDTAVHLWLGRMIRRTPWVPRAVPIRASYEPHKGIFNVFHILRDPQGCRATPLRTRKGIYTTGIDKNSARASYLAVRAPCGPRTGCSRAV